MAGCDGDGCRRTKRSKRPSSLTMMLNRPLWCTPLPHRTSVRCGGSDRKAVPPITSPPRPFPVAYVAELEVGMVTHLAVKNCCVANNSPSKGDEIPQWKTSFCSCPVHTSATRCISPKQLTFPWTTEATRRLE
jgi:hypothetical protein